MPHTNSFSFLLYAAIGAFILLLFFSLWHSARRSSHKHRDNPSKKFNVRVVQVSQSPEISERQSLWTTLTEREKKVAYLAAQNESDMEIARELQISVRTVESHLYRVYRKLKIRSRHELKYIIRHLEE